MSETKLLFPWVKQKNYKPITVVKAEGIYFWDADGKKYYDMSSQFVNVNIGHGNNQIKNAMKEQIDKIQYIAPIHDLKIRRDLSERIIELAPNNMEKVFFTTGGADANENAIKIAKMYTRKNKIFSNYISYHGASYGAGNLTGMSRRFISEPGIPGFVKFFAPFPYREKLKFEDEEKMTNYYLDKLRQQIIYEGDREKVAAIFVEPITGGTGLIIPPKSYLKGIRDICDEFQILMICDEVMTGWGRTGKYFAIEHFDVKPDIITFAKGITSGYIPLGGVIVSREIAEYFEEEEFTCGLTYSGHPIGCATAIATLNVYKDKGLIKKSESLGEILKVKLDELKFKYDIIGDIRSIGLFGAIEFNKNEINEIKQKLLENGVSVVDYENIIILSPPLIINEEELDEVFKIINEVLYELA